MVSALARGGGRPSGTWKSEREIKRERWGEREGERDRERNIKRER